MFLRPSKHHKEQGSLAVEATSFNILLRWNLVVGGCGAQYNCICDYAPLERKAEDPLSCDILYRLGTSPIPDRFPLYHKREDIHGPRKDSSQGPCVNDVPATNKSNI